MLFQPLSAPSKNCFLSRANWRPHPTVGTDKNVNFEAVEKIANAVLYEGYMLYPYRPSSTKNRQRWNFGTLYPQTFAETQNPPEAFSLRAECLAETSSEARLTVRVRFLHL